MSVNESEWITGISTLTVAALFTKHRQQYLRTHGKRWFHAAYDLHSAYGLHPAYDLLDSAPSDYKQIESSSTSDFLQTSEAKPSPFVFEQILEGPVANGQAPIIPGSDFGEIDLVESHVVAQDALPAHWKQPVDLFPLSGQPELAKNSTGDAPQSGNGNEIETDFEPGTNFEPKTNFEPETDYDLNVFDNGEMEEPPLAIRDERVSTFESVPYDAKRHGETYEDVGDELAPLSLPKTQDPLSSADIAKLRLKKCL